jgi:hypothetical protein
MADDFDKTRTVDPDRMRDPRTDDQFEERRTDRWPNPDFERAQPGDVVGVERGGETTELGETAEDEDERRRDAEKQVREKR